ncbi:MAG: preprotein translocase subunit SecG [Vicinamibacterales bacterium]|jgi:preprotein translocase subunit SecG|nr:preprotein translocase subunit SecG [Acidobacteriota bacterium]MDP6371658.1 preprotein translocase subunit SecG [Vicinamibacterales bacterium]MDP6610036.1 preprotein translocase subunit SecG [Vicinamibacterales bacterium]HAK54661.1 preprotein translocase subunit SecG [Acidobacteriota bacterium]|tara:strand:- start:15639 stop:16034 length:396 start_codon:yes stop_codon:yes gene_type:complete
MFYYVLLGAYIVACFFLILVVLLQQGKGGDIAAAFGGGGSQTAFGARGSATVLTKATTVLGVLFIVGALTLAIIGQRGPGSLLSGVGGPAPAAAPLLPITTSEPETASEEPAESGTSEEPETEPPSEPPQG